jgi:hypothetical protein
MTPLPEKPLLPDLVLFSSAVSLIPESVRERALTKAPAERERVYELARDMRAASVAYARALFEFVPKSDLPFPMTDGYREVLANDAAQRRDLVYRAVLGLLQEDPDSESLSEDEQAVLAMRCAADAYANVLALHLPCKAELLKALL